MDTDLTGALEEVKKMENTTMTVMQQFTENRQNIEAAEKAAENASVAAEAANKVGYYAVLI